MKLHSFKCTWAVATSLAFLISTSVAAQGSEKLLPIDPETNKVLYAETVYTDSTESKEVLLLKARAWFANAYNSSMDVIQLNDGENGLIIGKALIPVFMTNMFGSKMESGRINYTITIKVKDGKYRYEITDFYHTGLYVNSSVGKAPDGGSVEGLIREKKGFWGNPYNKTYGAYISQMHEEVTRLIFDLKTEMKKKSTSSDW